MENMEEDLLKGLTKDQWAEKIKWRKNESYVFVSYASLDWKIVYPIVVQLQDMGFDIYIDTEFIEEANTGWLEKMKKRMSDTYCEGIISFISINSLRSYAVLIEQLFSRYHEVTQNFEDGKIPNFYISLGYSKPQDIHKEIFAMKKESGAMAVRAQLDEGPTIKKYLDYYLRQIHIAEVDIKSELEKIDSLKNKHQVAIMLFNLFVENASLIMYDNAEKCSKILEKNFTGDKNTTINFQPNKEYIANTNQTLSIKQESDPVEKELITTTEHKNKPTEHQNKLTELQNTTTECQNKTTEHQNNTAELQGSTDVLLNVDACSSRIGQVLRVLLKIQSMERPIINYSKAVSNAAKEVAGDLGVTSSTINDKCCRQMKLTAGEFSDMVQKWFEQNELNLKNHMLQQISNEVEDVRAINKFFFI